MAYLSPNARRLPTLTAGRSAEDRQEPARWGGGTGMHASHLRVTRAVAGPFRFPEGPLTRTFQRMKKPEFEIYEDRFAADAHEQRVGPRAGIFLLHGRFFVANHATMRSRALVEQGALCVASVTFDGVTGGRESAGGSAAALPVRLGDVQPLPVRGGAGAVAPPPRN